MRLNHDLSILENAIHTHSLMPGESSHQDLRKCEIDWIENLDLRNLLLTLCHQANVNAEWNLQILGAEGLQYTVYNEGDH